MKKATFETYEAAESFLKEELKCAKVVKVENPCGYSPAGRGYVWEKRELLFDKPPAEGFYLAYIIDKEADKFVVYHH